MKRQLLTLSYLIHSIIILSQNLNYSHIKTQTMMDENDPNKYLEVIQYYDGLGRPVQTVQVGATHRNNSLVTLQEYDANGRIHHTWLPAIIQGIYKDFTDITSLKPTAIASNLNDPNPFTETRYEASPLNRVTEQYGPGADWHNSGSSNKVSYSTNELTGDLSCLYFKVIGNGLSTLLTRSGVYDARELYVIKTTNEIGNLSYEFKNKQEQVILSRQMNGNIPHDTYYVYDDFGNLAYVIPPILADKIINENKAMTDNSLEIRQYAYLYKYDDRNRCVKKRLPGCGWIQYVYDNADRLIFTQDAEQCKKGQWTYSIPDAFGRIVATGICNNTISNDYYKDKIVIGTYEARNGYFFSNFNPINNKYLTINFYDNYHFLNDTKKAIADIIKYDERPEYGKQNKINSYSANGLLTGTYVSSVNLDWENAFDEYSALYYDENNRLIQSKKTRMDNLGYNKEYLAYNFQGQPIKRLCIHSIIDMNRTDELYSYEYDHAGRLVETKHKLDNGEEVVISKNTYDEMGRIESTVPNNQEYLRTDYIYDIRSQISEISNEIYRELVDYDKIGNITNIYDFGHYRTGAKEWDMSILYDKLSRIVLYEDKYQGSAIRVPNVLLRYDKHGNITSVNRKIRTDEGYKCLDNLKISHFGNQIQSIIENSEEEDMYNTYDFKDLSGLGPFGSYIYNMNGAITEDPYKGATIENNLLNLPQEIKVSNPLTSGNIEYIYLATGEKLGSISSVSLRRSFNPSEIAGGTSIMASTDRTEWIIQFGNIVYKINDDGLCIDKILIDNGYIKDGNYYFYVKDHVGNNRATTSSTGQVKALDDYFPYGMPIKDAGWEENPQTFKFGNKKFETLMRLNLYDFHARLYDPAIARFMSIDPLSEKYYSVSPYVYCNNNPLRYIDPDGKQIRPARPPVRRGYKNGGRPSPYAHYPGGVKPQSYKKVTSYSWKGTGLRSTVVTPQVNYINTIKTAGLNEIQISSNNKHGMGVTSIMEGLAAKYDFEKLLFDMVQDVTYTENGLKISNTHIEINDPFLRIQQLEYEIAAQKINDELETRNTDNFTLENVIKRRQIIHEKLGYSPKEIILTEIFKNPNGIEVLKERKEIKPEFRQGGYYE